MADSIAQLARCLANLDRRANHHDTAFLKASTPEEADLASAANGAAYAQYLALQEEILAMKAETAADGLAQLRVIRNRLADAAASMASARTPRELYRLAVAASSACAALEGEGHHAER